MAENNEAIQNQDQEQDQLDTQPKTYTQEEIENLRKEWESKGYVKGKTDSNKKWEAKIAEREKLAKEEAIKQAEFANMSETQKTKAERDDYKKQLDELKDQIALTQQKDETRKLMKDKGLADHDLYLRAVLVKGDAEATAKYIDDFKALWEADLQKSVEAKITTHTPKQSTAVKSSNITNAEREAMGLPPL